MSKKEVILKRSTEVFLKFGLSKISMDELADQIGISKKTIYNNYGSKENLLEQIIFSLMQTLLQEVTDLLTRRDKTVMEKIYLAFNSVYKQYSLFENPIKFDQNAARIVYSPECIVLSDQIQEAIHDLAIEAKKQGLIKPHIQIEMFPYIFLNIIRGLSTWTRPDNVTFSKLDLMKHTLEITLDGILTTDAIKEFLNT